MDVEEYQDVLIKIPKELYRQIGHISVEWGLSKRTTIHHLLLIAVAEVKEERKD